MIDFERIAEILSWSFSENHVSIETNELKEWLVKNLDSRQMILNYWSHEEELWNSFDDYEKVEAFLMPYLDTRPEQQMRLVCMNIPLYGNYFRWDESSVSIFLDNASIESGDYFVKKELKSFFKELGFKKELVDQLFQLAIKQLKEDEGSHHGCLFQFFDEFGSYPYSQVDQAAYVSYDFGVPLHSVQPSEVVLGQRELRAKSIDLAIAVALLQGLRSEL